MKSDPKNIVRVYLVAVTRTDYQTHKCIPTKFLHAFTNEEDAQALVEKEIHKEKEYVESNSMIIESIQIESDNAYMYGRDANGNSFYFEAYVAGSIPVIFNYEDDWKSFDEPDIYPYTSPDKQILPETLHIVNQNMSLIGGCLPDLPDSAYINKEDAYRRIDYIFQDTKECWESEFANNGEIKYEEKTDPYTKSITPNVRHYYFEVYYSGEVPLN